MIDIADLRVRLVCGEIPRWVAVDIQDEPEIKAAYLDYECRKLAQGATRADSWPSWPRWTRSRRGWTAWVRIRMMSTRWRMTGCAIRRREIDEQGIAGTEAGCGAVCGDP